MRLLLSEEEEVLNGVMIWMGELSDSFVSSAVWMGVCVFAANLLMSSLASALSARSRPVSLYASPAEIAAFKPLPLMMDDRDVQGHTQMTQSAIAPKDMGSVRT